MTPAAALDLYRRAVANEAELKAWIATKSNDRWAPTWHRLLPTATELVVAAREAVELAA